MMVSGEEGGEDGEYGVRSGEKASDDEPESWR